MKLKSLQQHKSCSEKQRNVDGETQQLVIKPFPAKDKYICLWQKLYFFKEGVCT